MKLQFLVKLYYIGWTLLFLILIYSSTILYGIRESIHKEMSYWKSQGPYKIVIPFNYSDKIPDFYNAGKKTRLKYILLWTPGDSWPFVNFLQGQERFIKENCSYTNCYITSDRNILGDITQFDVVAFSGIDVVKMNDSDLPSKRSIYQKFVFTNLESSHNYPVCSDRFNGYFNWTWTYRLDSDSKWEYFVVKHINGTVIGPKKEMHWMKVENMYPVSDELKNLLRGKSRAAAWIVSHCDTLGRREEFVRYLQRELYQYRLNIDIFGDCGWYRCDRHFMDECWKTIEKHYYFYLAFENSISEDYVTEKLLNSLKYKIVPIVYGGANYSRFMPDGIYLDARDLGVRELAAKMNELIDDFDNYTDYFKWKNHYEYFQDNETPETNDYCGFCSLINNEDRVKETTIYQNFRRWWDPPQLRC